MTDIIVATIQQNQVSFDSSSVMITLIPNDNVPVKVPENVLKDSKLINDMIQDLDDDDETNRTIQLPNINSPTLNKIIEYLTYHADPIDPSIPKNLHPVIEAPIKSIELKDIIPENEWDVSYIDSFKEDYSLLFDVILGANYLDIQPLLMLACCKVAVTIKSLPPKEIRKKFNINPSPEDEKRIKEEFANIFGTEDFSDEEDLSDSDESDDSED